MYCFGETRSKIRRPKEACLPPYIRNYLTPSFIPDLEPTSSFGKVSLYLETNDRKLHRLLPAEVTANLRFFLSLAILFHGACNISVKPFVPKIGALPSTKKKGIVGLGLARETIEDFFQPAVTIIIFEFLYPAYLPAFTSKLHTQCEFQRGSL